MFRTLLAHPQEAIYKQHLVYCVRVTSVGCYQDWSETGVATLAQNRAETWDSAYRSGRGEKHPILLKPLGDAFMAQFN
jgi:hypothetical protein